MAAGETASAMTHPRARHVLAALALAVWVASPLSARGQKTVFHGMPVEPETGLQRGTPTPSVAFERAWLFAGFTAPLAGDPVSTPPHVAATDRSGQVVLIDAGTGAAIWTVALGETADIGPAVDGATIYQGTVPGTMAAIAVEGGAVLWRAAIGGAPLAPPVAADGRLFVVTETPELVAIEPRDGAILGRAPLPGRPLPPAAAGGRVVVGTDHGIVVSFDGATLAVGWRRDLHHPVTSPPTPAGRRVLVGTADRAVWSLRARSGRTSWRQRTGSIVTARPRAIGGLLYVSCWDNDVYVLRERNGHLLGRARLDHRLSDEVAWQFEHLFVTPYTEGSLVALALPYLGVAGRHDLGVPGEWFTTAPVSAAGGIAVGWGRDTGHLLALKVGPAPEPPAADEPAPPDQPAPAGQPATAGQPAAAPVAGGPPASSERPAEPPITPPPATPPDSPPPF